MNFAVIIPVVNLDLFADLLSCIDSNRLLPKQLIVINNSGAKWNGFRKDAVVIEGPLGVNASWEAGRKMVDESIQYISVLNDDLLIRPDFFHTTAGMFQSNLRAGVVCPVTVRRKELLNKFPYSHPTTMPRREGWAFTIRKWVWDRIKPIPEELTTFCGDDWIWHWSHVLGFYWKYNIDTSVYHYGSTTVRTLDAEGVPLLKEEKRKFIKLITEMR